MPKRLTAMYKSLIDTLERGERISRFDYLALIKNCNDELCDYSCAAARRVRQQYYGNDVYIRGLIEFTNICKNDCFYCGIRKSNTNAMRYRLSKEQILSCCESGYALGFRTFVLQGGEDAYFTDEIMSDIVKSIKLSYPDCRITLSLGERSRESYALLKSAGADRYLLRHETINPQHYKSLHPKNMSHSHRLECLKNLKELGYQTGCGFMVGSPNQSADDLADELMFLRQFEPAMVGIGPFIPHKDTPFCSEPSGDADLTVFLLSLIRLTLPKVLLPATTALGTARADGRERGLLAGANVVMPNLSPVDVRSKYSLYDNKICTGEEAAQCIECLKKRVASVGYTIVTDKGDTLMKY